MSDHGYVRYTRGCRCATCRDAKSDYMRERRVTARASAQRPSDLGRLVAAGEFKHGTRFGYEERGCRCLDCTRARSESDRKYRRTA